MRLIDNNLNLLSASRIRNRGIPETWEQRWGVRSRDKWSMRSKSKWMKGRDRREGKGKRVHGTKHGSRVRRDRNGSPEVGRLGLRSEVDSCTNELLRHDSGAAQCVHEEINAHGSMLQEFVRDRYFDDVQCTVHRAPLPIQWVRSRQTAVDIFNAWSDRAKGVQSVGYQ